METSKRIKELFETLEGSEQALLISELKLMSKESTDPDTSLISDFSMKHQKAWGESITFVSKTFPGGAVVVEMTTAFGKFTGAGFNKKAAKVGAIKEANKKWTMQKPRNV